MKTLSSSAADEWCRNHGIEIFLSGKQITDTPGLHVKRFSIPEIGSRLAWFSRVIEDAIRPWDQCLLLCTAWGVWESSENWHLYYRLRESYGDRLLIHDAPAHLFLDFETRDVTTFIQIALLSGWDFWLLSSADYARVNASHNGWIDFLLKDDLELGKLRISLVNSGVALIE